MKIALRIAAVSFAVQMIVFAATLTLRRDEMREDRKTEAAWLNSALYTASAALLIFGFNNNRKSK